MPPKTSEKTEKEMTDIPNIFDFEKTVGMTYLEAVEYLKKINLLR